MAELDLSELLREADRLRARRNALLPPVQSLAAGKGRHTWTPTEDGLAEYKSVLNRLAEIEDAIQAAHHQPASI